MNITFFDSRENSDVADQIVKNTLLIDRGYLFGDGFFTTGIVKDGQLCFQEYHNKRLVESANRLRFNHYEAGFISSSEFTNFLKPIELASIRITVTREQVTRGYGYSPEAGVNISVQISSLNELPVDFCQLTFAKTPASINPMFAGLKHLNRLDNVFAASEITDKRQETLLCDKETVISGSRSNLFIRENDLWLTPKLSDAGVNGITKQRVLKMMDTKAINYLQCDITKDRVRNCSAAFITNSLFGIWIVDTIETQPIPTLFSEKLKSKLCFKRD